MLFMICREEARQLIACLRSSILKETGIGVEVNTYGIAKNNEVIKVGNNNHVPIINIGTPQPDTHRWRGGQICTKAWHEQNKSSTSGWVGGGSRLVEKKDPTTMWKASAYEVSYNARHWYCHVWLMTCVPISRLVVDVQLSFVLPSTSFLDIVMEVHNPCDIIVSHYESCNGSEEPIHSL